MYQREFTIHQKQDRVWREKAAKSRKRRRAERIKNILIALIMAFLWACLFFAMANAWAEEKPVTLHDHTLGYEQQYAGTNWATAE